MHDRLFVRDIAQLIAPDRDKQKTLQSRITFPRQRRSQRDNEFESRFAERRETLNGTPISISADMFRD